MKSNQYGNYLIIISMTEILVACSDIIDIWWIKPSRCEKKYRGVTWHSDDLWFDSGFEKQNKSVCLVSWIDAFKGNSRRFLLFRMKNWRRDKFLSTLEWYCKNNSAISRLLDGNKWHRYCARIYNTYFPNYSNSLVNVGEFINTQQRNLSSLKAV